MKKNGILNSDISRVLSYMGHTDWICVGDCGLPIPDEVERIDLALEFGVPTFMKTLEVVTGDMKVVKIILAEEIKTMSPTILEEYRKRFSDDMIEFIPHSELDKNMEKVNFAIRTGQYGFHAPNVIIQVGCTYDE